MPLAPLSFQERVIIFLVPSTLEQSMLAEVGFPPHAKSLHQPPGRFIARVATRVNTMEFPLLEGQLQQPACSFAGKAASLKVWVKNPADLPLPRFGRAIDQRYFAHQLGALPQFYSQDDAIVLCFQRQLRRSLADCQRTFIATERRIEQIARDIFAAAIGKDGVDIAPVEGAQAKPIRHDGKSGAEGHDRFLLLRHFLAATEEWQARLLVPFARVSLAS
jgi:hypothetical protein